MGGLVVLSKSLLIAVPRGPWAVGWMDVCRVALEAVRDRGEDLSAVVRAVCCVLRSVSCVTRAEPGRRDAGSLCYIPSRYNAMRGGMVLLCSHSAHTRAHLYGRAWMDTYLACPWVGLLRV